MRHSTPRLSQLVAAFAVVAAAVPATSFAQDYRSPDSRAAALEAQREKPGYVDLRSPDARDAERAAQSPPPPPEIAKAPGFDWGDAGIGAGSVLGLLLIALSIMFALVHRRSRKVEGSGGPGLTA